ncbi:hypothetical protein [Thermoanaerobacter uzonensis]|uniref:hypothetical protein n=1 Tax=Thermoanaerobacter uzonensis TaxID=447593 RepID=UPI003D76871C
MLNEFDEFDEFYEFDKLRKSPYAGTPYEGLEECLPQFKSASILLYEGRKRVGGHGNKRKSRHNAIKSKTMRYSLSRWS